MLTLCNKLPQPPRLQPGPCVPRSPVSADSSCRAEVTGASAHTICCDQLLGRVPLLLATEDALSKVNLLGKTDMNRTGLLL